VVAVVLVVRTTVDGQTLDLDVRPEAPLLDDTFAAQRIGELQGEIAAMPPPESYPDVAEAAIVRALVSYRILVADLMAVGDGAQEAGSAGVVAGFRLARGRDDLDRILSKLLILDRQGADAEQFGRVMFDIQRFSDRVTEQGDALRDVTGDELAVRLARILAPLVQAMTALEAAPVHGHWVVLESAPRSTQDTEVSTIVELEALRQRLADAPLEGRARQEVELIIGFLERGSAFSEWQPLVREYQFLLGRIIDFAEALNEAAWMSQEDRDQYAARIDQAVMRFRDPRTRASGMEQLKALDVSGSIIENMTLLQEQWRVERREIESVRSSLDTTNADGLPAHLDELMTLAVILDGMTEFRRLGDEDVELSRELRVPHRDLTRACERAERALLAELDMLKVVGAQSVTDPAFSSLLSDQRQYLSDLRRIRRVPAWVETIDGVDPDSTDLFAADVRRLSRSLLDSNKRPDAILALDRLEDQLERYFPMPFEAELRPATPAAVVATGALHEALAVRIAEARRLWVEAWTDGDATEADRAMKLLYRLMRIMADTAPIAAREGDATLLNRWAMWELPDGVIARPMSDLPARLKLATAAAIDGNNDDLDRQLDQLERDAPLTRLAGCLLAELGPSLDALPSGARSQLGQTVYPPHNEAWLASRRDDLANLCRYSMELEYARLTGRTELADILRRYVNDLAQEILAEVSK
jgi:hypothetical protein